MNALTRLGAAVAMTAPLTFPCAVLADGMPGGPGQYYSPAINWGGAYVGINGGYGWNGNQEDIRYTAPANGFAGTGRGFDADGGFGGGQIGYNWRRDHFVFGIEADIQGSGVSDRSNLTVIANNGTALGVASRQDLDYFGTVRGRLGYAFGGTMIYATGGFAYGEVNDRVLLSNLGATALLRKDDTETGFVVGGGVEHYFAPRWSAKLEYQYVDLGSDRLTAVSSNGVFLESSKIDSNFQTVRIGLNYHFYDDAPRYVPLK
jgi:outer membrane immunogenic protein